MKNQTVPVLAEWALWGKEPHDVEYRLLRCSDGTLGEDNFDEVITRYAPGTLESLPQVTVGWLAGAGRQNYLALAIHREPEHALYDASGRKVVLTDCFCVPFEELAAGAVSYRAMYAEFRKISLPLDSGSRIKTSLPMQSPPARVHRLAIPVAALLLTNKPVCILGANGVGLDARLGFFDSVMALLPYGMRSRLSVATWASSIFDEHKFRLFFAGARRCADDHVVTWDQHYRRLIVDDDVHEYLTWLESDLKDHVGLLAEQAEPIGFSQADLAQTLTQLRGSDGRPADAAYERDIPYAPSWAAGKARPARKRRRRASPRGPLPAEAHPARKPVMPRARTERYARIRGVKAQRAKVPASVKRTANHPQASRQKAGYLQIRVNTAQRFHDWRIDSMLMFVMLAMVLALCTAGVLILLSRR
jgi:hypothetical protein